jgi:hypothetical protein
MSLWRILIVRYSRLSPRTVFISFEHLAGAVMRIDDAVADLELDVRGSGSMSSEVLQLLFH